MTLPEALRRIAKDYRSHSEAALVLEIDKAHWFRMLAGKLTNPSSKTLTKLGLKEQVVKTYELAP